MANVTRYKTSKGEVCYRVRYRKPDGTQTDTGGGVRRKIDAENWAAKRVTVTKAEGTYIDPTGRILVVVATPVCFAALDGGLGLVRLYHAVLMSSSIFSDGFL